MRSFTILLVATCVLALSTLALAENRPCSIAPALLPACVGTQQPVRNSTTNCPSCRIACTLNQLKACANTTLRTCAANEEPELEACCVTCKPAEVRCTETQLETCKNSHATLPVCANTTAPVFNQTSCCYNCRPAPPAPALKPDNSGRCNKDQFEACIAAAPVCASGEVPDRNKTQQCCPTCKRPERLCSKEDLVQCRATTPACTSTEVPVSTDGQCCPSCHLTRPNCTATCPTGTVCVRRLANPTTGAPRDPTCRNVTVAKLFFRAANATRHAIIANISCDQLVDMVKEIVQRFCDKNENADTCSTYKESFDNLYASVGTTCQANADGTVPVQVTVPAPVDGGAPASAVNLLSTAFASFGSSSTSASAQVVSAVADTEAADGYAVSVNETSAATGTILSMATTAILAVVAVVFLN